MVLIQHWERIWFSGRLKEQHWVRVRGADRGECEGWWQLKANINNPGLLYYPPALEVVYIRGVKITPDWNHNLDSKWTKKLLPSTVPPPISPRIGHKRCNSWLCAHTSARKCHPWWRGATVDSEIISPTRHLHGVQTFFNTQIESYTEQLGQG